MNFENIINFLLKPPNKQELKLLLILLSFKIMGIRVFMVDWTQRAFISVKD